MKPGINKKFNENDSWFSEKCKCCGKQKHDKRVCPTRDIKCWKCSKTGHYVDHYANVCLSRPQKGYSEVAYLGVTQLEN